MRTVDEIVSRAAAWCGSLLRARKRAMLHLSKWPCLMDRILFCLVAIACSRLGAVRSESTLRGRKEELDDAEAWQLMRYGYLRARIKALARALIFATISRTRPVTELCPSEFQSSVGAAAGYRRSSKLVSSMGAVGHARGRRDVCARSVAAFGCTSVASSTA